MNNLTPRHRYSSQRGDENPFFALHREMARLFDDAFRLGAAPFSGGDAASAWPQIEIMEDDKTVRVCAELPGLEEKDIELKVENDTLTLKGEKRTETEFQDRQYSERYYGRFERRLPLPAEIDEEAAEASFKNGVLIITFPKTEKAKDAVKRIPIRSN